MSRKHKERSTFCIIFSFWFIKIKFANCIVKYSCKKKCHYSVFQALNFHAYSHVFTHTACLFLTHLFCFLLSISKTYSSKKHRFKFLAHNSLFFYVCYNIDDHHVSITIDIKLLHDYFCKLIKFLMYDFGVIYVLRLFYDLKAYLLLNINLYVWIKN